MEDNPLEIKLPPSLDPPAPQKEKRKISSIQSKRDYFQTITIIPIHFSSGSASYKKKKGIKLSTFSLQVQSIINFKGDS